MALIVWITQSFLLSVAIFVLCGEELVLDRQGNLLCLKATPAAGENKQPYSSKRWNSNSQCCNINRTTTWQIPFGVLAVVQTCFSLVVYGVRTRRKSLRPFLDVVCATCWALTFVLLLTKLGVHLTPWKTTPQTTENSGYAFTLFTFAWNILTAISTSAFQRISLIFADYVSTSEKRNILLEEKLQDGLYFCSSELDNQALEQTGVNLSRVIVVLTVAYFISSGYTLYHILAHEERSEPVLKPVNNNITGPSAEPERTGELGWDNSDVGGVGEGHCLQRCPSGNVLRGLNKKELIVAFMEEESDEDSFVLGWRL